MNCRMIFFFLLWLAPLPSPLQLDSRSFFFDIAPGAESAASGLVALLAAAQALRNATQEAQPNRTILYTFFQGVGSALSCYLCPRARWHRLDLTFIPCACVFGFRKPLTTLAVQRWCMTCRTISFLWTWTTCTQYWRLDRWKTDWINSYSHITLVPVVSDYFVIGLVSIFCLCIHVNLYKLKVLRDFNSDTFKYLNLNMSFYLIKVTFCCCHSLVCLFQTCLCFFS